MTDTSRLTVDPGAIRDFARFLDAQAPTLKRLRDRMRAAEGRGVDFGEHPSAPAAERTHLTAVRAAAEHGDRVVVRHEELVLGTEELAKQYSELSELNTAASDDITAIMEQGAEGA